MNKYIPLLRILLIFIYLSACSQWYSPVRIDTAIAETQSAIPTSTFYPTYTQYTLNSLFPPTPYPTKIQFYESFSIRLFPGIEASMVYDSETGTELWFEFPKNATLQAARVMIIPGLSTTYPPDWGFYGDAFDLLAGVGDQMEGFKGFSFNAPIMVTIKFSIISLPVEKLSLYYWTGNVWEKVEIACNLPLPIYNTTTNTIKTSICSPGTYGIFSLNKN
jgi:hypothetical protein